MIFKKSINKFLIFALACCFAVLSQSSFALKVDKIIAFGDSTSDNGNIYSITEKLHKVISAIPLIPKLPPYYQGRFSNGPIWVEILAQSLGVDLLDYAYGGSWAEPLQESHQIIPFSLGMQVNMYLVKGYWDRHKENHLYTIWTGANDYLEGRDDIEHATTTTVETIRDNLTSLIYYGARQFLIIGVPDVSLTPKARAEGPVVQAQLQQLSKRHNEKLAVMIQQEQRNHPEAEIVYLDIEEILTDVNANPESYGVKDVTNACYKGSYYFAEKFIEDEGIKAAKAQKLDILGNPSLREAYLTAKLAERGVQPCNNPQDYLFWDKVHPTAKAHSMLASLVEYIIEGEDINNMQKLRKAINGL